MKCCHEQRTYNRSTLARCSLEVRAVYGVAAVEGGYTSLYDNPRARWFRFDRLLSSDVAGEAAAVYIYIGALWALRIRQMFAFSGESRALVAATAFAERHIISEGEHLAFFETIIPSHMHTSLGYLWRISGFLLGCIPTLLCGRHGLYHTVEAVETFVEQHYEEQITSLEHLWATKRTELWLLTPFGSGLVPMLRSVQADEVVHKDEAAEALLGMGATSNGVSWVAQIWRTIVKRGCWASAEIAKYI